VLKEHLNLTRSVEFPFVVSESGSVPIGFIHSLDKSMTVDEGKQCDAHPLIASTIDVNVEVGRVEVNDL
jgi:hypothetical protein